MYCSLNELWTKENDLRKFTQNASNIGKYITGDDMTAENIEANWEQISDMTDATLCYQGGDQSMKAFTLIQESKK